MRWFFAGLIALLFTAFLVIRSDFFNIKFVEVQLDKITCADSNQIKNSSKLLGQNFFLLNSTKVREVIKNNFLCIRDVQISRIFPNKVRIFVSGRDPKALLLILKNREATQSALENIATPSAQGLEGIEGLEVDEEGIIFQKTTSDLGIPKIYLQNNLTLDKKASGTILETLKILEKIKSYGLDVRVSEILDGLFLIYPPAGGPKIVFKLGGNLDTQLASLQLILNKAKIDDEKLEFIDLRFDKPVVKLAPKKN